MKPTADDLILWLIALLTVAAAGVTAWQPIEFARGAAVGREFQSALGGLGMGCDVNLTRCTWQFDPRIAGDEEPGLEAVIGLGELSPWHSLSMFPVSAEDIAVEGE